MNSVSANMNVKKRTLRWTDTTQRTCNAGGDDEPLLIEETEASRRSLS